ncbi:sensor histidine kinase [Clostridium sp. Marseille-P299]|uniref:sensor histidine kinase n=1 Tax=Clostridium sp. Marseille-P299 TaxID=1805477 RepID=UPI0018D31A7D|nr:sensor histidine kinase [Clostridium sp. Marseille-P299]
MVAIQNILIFLVEIIKLSMVMVGLFDYKLKNKMKYMILFSVIILLLSSFLAVNLGLNKNISAGVIICFIIIVIINSITGHRKVLMTFIAYFGISLIDIIISGCIQFLLRIDSVELYKSIPNLLVDTISIGFILLLILIKKKIAINISESFLLLKKRYLYIVFLGIIGCGLYVAPIQIFGLINKSSIGNSLIIFAIYASGIVFIMICVGMVIMNDSNIHYKNINEMNQRLLKQQKLYYQTIIEKEQYTKRFRHDINNHIYCLQHLCEQKKYDELTEYLYDMQKHTAELNLDIQTGNDIVNIIVNDLYSKNKADNIIIKWTGLLPEILKISSMDLCTIFSNLISNAIEAVRILDINDKKVIDVQIRRMNANIVIQISNPVKEQVNILNNRLTTTKKNKDQHGLGSLNVERCVQKYQGQLQYRCIDNIFTANIVFLNIVP